MITRTINIDMTKTSFLSSLFSFNKLIILI